MQCFLTSPMNDYIFTSTKFLSSDKIGVLNFYECIFMRYFQPNRPKKLILIFFDRCETLPLNVYLTSESPDYNSAVKSVNKKKTRLI